MCHVLFSDILLSIISIWVIGSFLLFLQINRQIGSCRRCKRTETIGILVTIICTSALLLQHLYYLLGVCVVTVACQYVHCSLIGKSTLDSESPKDNFFQVVLKMKINYWKGKGDWRQIGKSIWLLLICECCMHWHNRSPVNRTCCHPLHLALLWPSVRGTHLAAGTIFTLLTHYLLHSISRNTFNSHWVDFPLVITNQGRKKI